MVARCDEHINRNCFGFWEALGEAGALLSFVLNELQVRMTVGQIHSFMHWQWHVQGAVARTGGRASGDDRVCKDGACRSPASRTDSAIASTGAIFVIGCGCEACDATVADKCSRGSNRLDFPDHRVDGAGARTRAFAQAALIKIGVIWQGMESRRNIAENLVGRFLGIVMVISTQRIVEGDASHFGEGAGLPHGMPRCVV